MVFRPRFDARAAHGALKGRSKSDRSDAEGPARLAETGLTPRRWQSGEVDRRGGVSKAGNGMARYLLYEAANSLLSRVKRTCALRDWAQALQARIGGKKARVALARKLAMLMHRLWARETEFDWRPTIQPA